MMFWCLLVLLQTPPTKTDCATRLETAVREIELGYDDQVLQLLNEDCLERLDGDDRLRAFELVMRAHYARDDLDAVRRIIDRILDLRAGYQPPTSLSELGPLVAEARARDIARIGSASFQAEDVDRIPATIAVITAEEIQRRGYRDLAEVLEGFPGLEVTRISGFERVLVHPRGVLSTANDGLLLRVDGVEQNDFFYGSSFLSSQYPLSHIDKVVLVYGPLSTVYGPNANLGVIDVITRAPDTKPGLTDMQIDATIGERNLRTVDLHFGGALEAAGEPIRYALTATTAREDGLDLAGRVDSLWSERDHFQDDSDNRWLSLRIWTGDLSFGVQHWRREEGAGSDDARTIPDGAPVPNWTPQQLNFFVDYRRNLGRGWSALIQARLKEWENDEGESGNYRDGQLVYWSYSVKQNRYKTIIVREDPDQRFDVAFGAEYRQLSLPGGLTTTQTDGTVLVQPNFVGLPTTPTQFSDDDIGLFLDLDYRITDQWSVSGGLRVDQNSSSPDSSFSFEDTENPRAALFYRPNERLNLKLLFAEAFLPPSLGFSMWPYRYLGDDQIGVIPPQNRRSKNLELSARWDLGVVDLHGAIYRFSQSETSAAGNRQEIEGSEGGFEWSFARRGSRRNTGGHLSLVYEPKPFRLTLDLAHVNAEILVEERWDDVEAIADQTADLRLEWSNEHLDAGLHLNWIGDRRFVRSDLFDPTPSQDLDRYLLVNGVLSGRIPRLPDLRWQCILRNITDQDYSHVSIFNYEIVPQPGREFALRFSYRK